jgi:hypothetical protein
MGLPSLASIASVSPASSPPLDVVNIEPSAGSSPLELAAPLDPPGPTKPLEPPEIEGPPSSTNPSGCEVDAHPHESNAPAHVARRASNRPLFPGMGDYYNLVVDPGHIHERETVLRRLSEM